MSGRGGISQENDGGEEEADVEGGEVGGEENGEKPREEESEKESKRRRRRRAVNEVQQERNHFLPLLSILCSYDVVL